MKKHVWFWAMMLLASWSFAQSEVPDWENPAVRSLGREEMHASFLPYASVEKAREGGNSDRVRSLNGAWAFRWSDKPYDRVMNFYEESYDVSSWATIDVPSDWAMRGYGYIHYTNIRYPFPKNFPHIPHDYNPTGQYRRTFDLDASWLGGKVFLEFGSVNSAFYLWVNGVRVGYSQDSKLPAEFDITRFVRKGRNTLAVEVYQWCDGSYLEDQDFFRMAGIEREVRLISRPALRIADFKLRSGLDATYTHGDWALDLNLVGAPQKASVRVSLWDGSKSLFSLSNTAEVSSNVPAVLKFQRQIPNVKKWSAEQPNLYRMEIELLDAKGKVLEATSTKIGFRTSEIREAQLWVNGKAILIKGVNRHEHDPANGHVVSHEAMLKDIQIMKAHNINAVRTCHYPNDPYWYQLCDEYGLYLYDEANIEAHDYGWNENELSVAPSYYDSYMERIQRMYRRDKNHPSVIVWSMGNESGSGPAFVDAYKWLHEQDASRPVHYDRAEFDPRFAATRHTDILGWMYASIEEIARGIRNDTSRPFIWCEYAHSMGNSTGDLVDLWNYVRSEKRVQGGFIWDWVDQGVDKVDSATGKKYWGFGGDFEPAGTPNDDNFCLNGLVNADRTPHPALYEVKQVYQNIHLRMLDPLKLRFERYNEYFFTSLDGFDMECTALLDGKAVLKKKINLPHLDPQQKDSFQIDWPELSKLPQGELYLNFSFREKAGDKRTLAAEQFKLRGTSVLPSVALAGELVSDGESKGIQHFHIAELKLAFDTHTGSLVSYEIAGHELIAGGLEPNFWRGPNDNDYGNQMPQRCKVWKTAATNRVLTSYQSQKQGSDYLLSFSFYLPETESQLELSYRISKGGMLTVSQNFTPGKNQLPELPRFGTQLKIDPSCSKVQWYGRGFYENYPDRQTGSFVGLYEAPTDSLGYSYTRPQENGNRGEVRWVRFSSPKGYGLLFGAAPLLNFSADRYELSDYDQGTERKKPKHTIDMKAQDWYRLTIDYKQMGVGGDNSWGARPHERYILYPKPYSFTYSIYPVLPPK